MALKRIGIETQSVEIEIPKDEKLGDISTPVAMMLSKELKRPPQQIAKEIIEGIDKNEQFEKIEVSGPGFINFTFKHVSHCFNSSMRMPRKSFTVIIRIIVSKIIHK